MQGRDAFGLDLPMTPEQLVEALKHGEPNERQKAMNEMFGDDDGGALLIRLHADAMTSSTTSKINQERVFVQLLYLAQLLAANFNLHLNWVEKPEDPNAIQIAPGDLRF